MLDLAVENFLTQEDRMLLDNDILEYSDDNSSGPSFAYLLLCTLFSDLL